MLTPPPTMESLEDRRLFTAASPTNLEQYMVEVINRARANPTAEAARLHVDLNEGLAAGTISTAAKQPLAINPALIASARGHSQWMVDTDTFSHTGAGGSSPGGRMSSAGYAFTGSWTWGENIAYRSGSLTASLIDQLNADLFVDSGISGRGHRTNLMAPAYREVGVGAVSGPFQNFTAGMLTEDFAKSGSSVFLTGVAYKDTVTKDAFYTPGEGLAGVTITAKRASDNATFTTATWASGGYSLALPAGTYAVTATGGGLASAISYGAVTVAADNVKRDFVPGTPTGGNDAPDTAAPTAALTRAKPLRTGGGKYYNFVVTYTDDTAIDPATLDGADLYIYGPAGYTRVSTFYNVDPSSTPTNQIVNYMVKAPGFLWDPADNGAYTIKLMKNQVADTAGNKAVAVTLGQFAVKIATTPAAARPAFATPFAAPAATAKHDQDAVWE